MSDNVTQWLDQLRQPDDDDAIEKSVDPSLANWMLTAEENDLQLFWLSVRELHDAEQLDVIHFNRLLTQLIRTSHRSTEPSLWADSISPVLSHIYRTWHDESQTRHSLLVLLTQHGGDAAWSQFAELMATDPPTDAQQAIESFLPIWRRADGRTASLFPRLLDSIEHLSVAAIVLDLANYLTREGCLEEHPAKPRAADLTWLLGQLVERLEGFEETSQKEGVRDLQVAQHVQETIALAVALTDTLVLLDHRDAMGKLYRMLELQHRRLRVEAAAGLAKFGEEEAGNALCEMAFEPLVRLRVHAYATELEIVDRIPGEFGSPEGLAESEFVIRLAEPDLFGFAPSASELIDERTLCWPGYEEPRQCYLFQYTYHLNSGDHSNIGLVGPVAHALMADLTGVELDDIYAVYAGWHVEHDDLRRVAYDPANPTDVETAMKLADSLRDMGYEQIEPTFWGDFFGERLLVAKASLSSGPGTVVVSRSSYDWFRQGDPRRPIDADLAYSMFVGRQLLRRFNDDFPSEELPAADDAGRSPSRQAQERLG